MLSRKELEDGLGQFTGTTQYYRSHPGVLLTDGAHWLAENAGCYWLYDIIWSVKPILAKDSFACLTLTVNLPMRRGRVVIENGNDRACYTQRIKFTDFPLPELKLYIADGEPGEKVIMLPGEY